MLLILIPSNSVKHCKHSIAVGGAAVVWAVRPLGRKIKAHMKNFVK